MSFSFEARTLLELGKELISTDEVALYELIKNAVDAQSPTAADARPPTVEIHVRSRLASHGLPRSSCRQLRESGKGAVRSDVVHSWQDGMRTRSGLV